MASGRWAGVAMACATVANANPFREGGQVAEPRHFDPFALLGDWRRRKADPSVKVRVSVLKDVFIDQKARG